jgi:hypothetical protein
VKYLRKYVRLFDTKLNILTLVDCFEAATADRNGPNPKLHFHNDFLRISTSRPFIYCRLQHRSIISISWHFCNKPLNNQCSLLGFPVGSPRRRDHRHATISLSLGVDRITYFSQSFMTVGLSGSDIELAIESLLNPDIPLVLCNFFFASSITFER